MFTNLQVSPLLCPSHSWGAGWHSRGVGDLVLVIWLKQSGGSWRAKDAPSPRSQHMAVLIFVTSAFSSLSPLPDFCLQKQSTEHFKTARETRLASQHKFCTTCWGGRMPQHSSALKSGLDLPLLTTTPGGRRMLYEQFWCSFYFADVSLPPSLTEQYSKFICKNK